MQTARDQEIVGFIARFGAASAEHVRARFGMCQSRAYARLRLLMRDGLLEHKQLLHRVPGLYVATREGLRWAGAACMYRLDSSHTISALFAEHLWNPCGRDLTRVSSLG